MNIQDTATTKSAYAIGQPVKRKEDGKLCAGKAATPTTSTCRTRPMPTSCAARSRTAGSSRSTPRPPRRCRACSPIYTGADIDSIRHAAIGAAVQEPGRLRLKKPPRPALPTDKVRFVGDPIACVVAETHRAGQGCLGSDRGRYRDAAGRHHAGPGGRQAGAPAIFEDVPGNVALDFHYGDSREGRSRLRRRRAQGQAASSSTPGWSSTRSSRARRSAATTRRRSATRCTSCSQGVMGLKAGIAARDEDHARQGAHHHRQCRRLVRHEGRGLSGIHLHPARGEDARPSGEMDRRTLVELRLRQPRPRPRADRRACAGRRRPFPGGAADRLWQSRRLPGRDVAAAADAQHGAERHQPLSHAAARSEHQVRVHQHDASSAPIAAPAGPRATTTWSG